MVYLKACPRCQGDLFIERDQHERYVTCLQCGHILTTLEESTLQFRTAQWTRVAWSTAASRPCIRQLPESSSKQ